MNQPRSWEGARLVVGAVVLIVAGFFFASRFVSPAPPKSIRFAAGQAGGAYTLFAERYRDELARHRIDVHVVETTGSADNLGRLLDGRVDIALVQAGIAGEESQALLSLGAVFHEPLWIFLGTGVEVERLSDLDAKRLEIGPPGSGTRALASRLLALNQVREAGARWWGDANAEDAASRLEAGLVDAVFLVGSVDSPTIRGLLENPQVRLLDVPRAEAYRRLDRSLTPLLLPRGVIDLRRDLPREDKALVATVAELVIHPDFHPALVDLILQAAAEIHRKGDLFAEPGVFPTPRWVDLDLSPEADRYFEYGPPFLQRYLPFWAATQIDRLKVMLIPLLALMLPLIRVFPPTYRWRVRSRIYRWYKELRSADPGQIDLQPVEDLRARLAEVDRIDSEVTKVPTPPSYAEELYSLRLHIDFIRRRLQRGIERAD